VADVVAEHIAALKDEDWAVREEAAGVLGTLEDARAVLPLVHILQDPDRAVRTAAMTSLTAIGSPAVIPLSACLQDKNLTVQEAAASILSSIADSRVLESLTVALRSPDWVVRMHAAKALGRIGDPRAVPALLPLLQDPVKAVREDVSTALALVGPGAVAPLIETLSHTGWLVRLHAVEALGKLRTPEAVEPLLHLVFNDADMAVREDAVRALGEIGDARAVDFLLVLMNTPGLRPLAIESLGKIGDRRAVSALVAVVTGEARPEVSRAIHGCGDRWDEEMLAMGAAVRALAHIKAIETVPTLVRALQQTVTRAEAATGLVAFGSPAIPPLLDVLKKEADENVRFHVKEALAQLGWRPGRI
jgi:HEAT repeat protein